jgi:hypothetical protein
MLIGRIGYVLRYAQIDAGSGIKYTQPAGACAAAFGKANINKIKNAV